MKLQLNIIKIIELADDLDSLTKIQKEQLTESLKQYFGQSDGNAHELLNKKAYIACYIQVVDAKSPDKAIYDFWEINVDSGTLFLPNSLKRTGVKKTQNSFCLDDGINNPDLKELADNLNIAKKVKVPEPIKVLLNNNNEIVEFKDAQDVPQKATNWTKFLKEHKLSQDLVNQYRSVFNDACWRLILSQTKLSDFFLESLAAEIGWKLVSEYQHLSESFIQKHEQFLDWKLMSYKQKFSESQVVQYQDRLDWQAVSWAQTLSPDLIARFSDKLNWESVCMHQKLDLKTIDNNISRLNKTAWNNISQKQQLSSEILDTYSDKIDWQYASMNLSITDEQLIQHADKINWSRIINYGRTLSYSLISELIARNSIAYDDIEDIVNERKKFELSDEQLKELKKAIKSLKRIE